MKGQPYGNIAKEVVFMLRFAVNVTIQTHDKDRYGRIVADIVLADETLSIRNWSKRACVGGIASMHRRIPSWKH